MTNERSKPATPVRSRELHAMMIAASYASSTASATRIRSVPGNAVSGPGTGSRFTSVTSLPSDSRASAIAIWLPMASPSGRAWELRTNRWRVRIAPTIAAIACSRSLIVSGISGRAVGGGLGGAFGVVPLDLLEQFFDARLVRDGLVELEGELGHASQIESRGQRAPDEGQR